MHWIYILKCKSDSDDFYYVGETTRLYRRFWEHADGKGGLNTEVYVPEHTVAIYNVKNILNFINYEQNACNNVTNYYKYARVALENFDLSEDQKYRTDLSHYCAENYIAECLMKRTANVRGGKYTRFDVDYKAPDTAKIVLPLCHCKLPCDIHKKDDDIIYFRCPKKNIWEEMRRNVNTTDEPACKFYQTYNDNNIKRMTLALRTTVKQAPWLWTIPSGYYEHCLGGCGREYDSDNCVRSSLNLCHSCFMDTNIQMKLKHQYDIKPDMASCLI
jgi:predicted GIY-YIG superfamily endonuclease